MSSYHDFRRRSLKRRMRQRIMSGAAVVLSVAVFGGVVWYAVSSLELFGLQTSSSSQSQSEAEPLADDTELPEVTPTATPQSVIITNQTTIATANETDANWNTVNYNIRVLSTEIKTNEDGTTAMDFRLAGVEENGVVDLSYFDGVAILGDSISQGFVVYDTDITNVGATFCAYQNISPKGVVDLSTWTNATGVDEIPLDVLAASSSLIAIKREAYSPGF